jgi:hypothetical protein
MTMPFGKYAGRHVGDLPRDYIRWCLRALTAMLPELRAAMRRALEDGPAATRAADVTPASAVVGRIDSELKSWYRRASLEHHPDRGGDVRAMIVINSAFEVLSSALGRIGGAR